ncbi:MAG: glycosyltransferase family 4 protein [Patescibacteria group bacterium]
MKVNYSIAAKLAGGGIGTTSYNAVFGIFRHGYLNRVFCTSYNRSKIGQLPNFPLFATHTSLVERFSFLSPSVKWQLKDSFHDLFTSFIAPKADIFHGWNGHCLRSLAGAKKSGAVTIVERASSHPDTYEKLLQEEYSRWGIKINPIEPAVKHRLLKELAEADYITTPSDFAYRSMIENGIPEKKLIRLSFGTETDKFKGLPAHLPAQAGAGQNSKFTALFVGQVGIRKGVPYLLEAWKNLNLKDADLYLLGEVESAAKKIIAPYRDVASIHFEGYKDPVPYFQKADVFVFPSIEEGSALVTFEALAAGVPLITTFNSGSVITDGKEGFLVPIRDSAAIADRLKELYLNETTSREMAVRAGETGRRYTWQAYGDSLVQAYEKIVN